MTNVLVVEDEVGLANAICKLLELSGEYQAKTVADGSLGYEEAMSGDYDIVVLDIMLPGMDGFEIVHRMRENGNTVPTIMLTARNSITDKVDGLDAGADDYMTKPFEMDELLARLRVMTRRKGNVVLDEQAIGNVRLNLATHELSADGDRKIHLSNKEFEVMRMLMDAGTEGVVSKQEFLSRIWGYDADDTQDNSVEAYISFLRKKLRYLHANVSIATLRSVGYRLDVQ